MPSTNPIVRDLLIIVVRWIIAVVVFVALAVLITVMFVGSNDTANTFYMTLYAVALVTSGLCAYIFRSSRIARIITFVVCFLTLVLIAGSGGFFSCLNSVNANLPYKSAEELKAQSMNYSYGQCLRKLLLPKMSDYNSGWLGYH